MNLIRSYVFWKYERGSFHYDVMVTLILLFVFVTPHLFDYHDHPAADHLSPSTVLVRPTDTGAIYEIPAEEVHQARGVLARQMEAPLALAIAPVSGPVTIDRWEPLKDESGKVTAYKVWAHR